MYIYLDKNGIVKEIINDEALRQASSNANTIHVYYEGYLTDEVSSVLATYELPDGTVTDEAEVATETTTGEVPYDAKRDLKYFKYYTDYEFYEFSVADEALAQDGTVRLMLRFVNSSSTYIKAQGLICFEVETEIVKEDYGVSLAQYNYLVKTWLDVDGAGAFLPLNGSKEMLGSLKMSSYPINLNGKELSNNDGKLAFDGNEIANKADVVTIADAQIITGAKKFQNTDLILGKSWDKVANTFVVLTSDYYERGIDESGVFLRNYDNDGKYSETSFTMKGIVGLGKYSFAFERGYDESLMRKQDVEALIKTYYTHTIKASFNVLLSDNTTYGTAYFTISALSTSSDSIASNPSSDVSMLAKFLSDLSADKVIDAHGGIYEGEAIKGMIFDGLVKTSEAIFLNTYLYMGIIAITDGTSTQIKNFSYTDSVSEVA